MEDSPSTVTHEQYIAMCIEDFFQDALAIEEDFLSWSARHAPTWHEQGRCETWIRQRIEMALTSRGWYRAMRNQEMTLLEIRDEVYSLYAHHTALYTMAIEQERLQSGHLCYRGNTSDLRRRHALRVAIYETDQQTYTHHCRLHNLPVPAPDTPFYEQPEPIRVVRDLSTVEELDMGLATSRYLLQVFTSSPRVDDQSIMRLVETYGQHLRASFINTHGYLPEESTTPYIPVTIAGPQEHDTYYAREYPS